MVDYEDKYKKLKHRYQELEKNLTGAKAAQLRAKQELPKIEAGILLITKQEKFSLEKVEAFTDKLDKELETRLVTLRDKTKEFERTLEEVKVGVEPEPVSEQAEEDDIENIFNKI